jgi:hypothetical protein
MRISPPPLGLPNLPDPKEGITCHAEGRRRSSVLSTLDRVAFLTQAGWMRRPDHA